MMPPFYAGYSSLLDPDDEETIVLCIAGTIQPMAQCHGPEELNHHQVTDIKEKNRNILPLLGLSAWSA